MKVKKINWLLMVIHLVVGFGISAVLVLVGGRSLPYEMADLMVGMAVFWADFCRRCLSLFLGALFLCGRQKNQMGRPSGGGGLPDAPAGSTATMPSWRLTRTRGKIGLLMRLNPFSVQILEASGIRSAEVSDGKG